MSRIPLPVATTPQEDEVMRTFALSPAFAKAMSTSAAAIYGKILLSMREREAVRMRVAQINQCQICLGFRFPELKEQGVTEEFYAQVETWKNNHYFSNREQLAIEYTERFLTDHLNIDDAFFKQLNEHFSAAEVFELTGIIAGLMANGRVMQVLQLNQTCTI